MMTKLEGEQHPAGKNSYLVKAALQWRYTNYRHLKG